MTAQAKHRCPRTNHPDATGGLREVTVSRAIGHLKRYLLPTRSKQASQTPCIFCRLIRDLVQHPISHRPYPQVFVILSAAPVHRRSRRTSNGRSFAQDDRLLTVRICSQALSAAKDPQLLRRTRAADSSSSAQNDMLVWTGSGICGTHHSVPSVQHSSTKAGRL